MGYKPSIVERMNRGLNFQNKSSLLKKSSPLRDTDPHTAEGGHSHAGVSTSTFSEVLPTGTRSTFQGSTTAKFDPSSVEKQQYVTGKNYLESTPESEAAYNALTPEQQKAQDKKALQLQAEENLKTQNINQAIDVANQAKIKQKQQEFELEQQNKATSQQFTIGDATEAQEQQASLSAFETFQSELETAKTAALENAGDIFSKTYQQMIAKGDTPDEARDEASKLANRALKQARYFTTERMKQLQNPSNSYSDPILTQYELQPGQQIQYVQGGRDASGNIVRSTGGIDLFGEDQTFKGSYDKNADDLYGVTQKYFDEKGRPIEYDKYQKLQKRGKDPRMETILGSELQKYIQQFQQ